MADVVALLEPLETEWFWQLSGRCRVGNPEVFFHPEGERGRARRRRVEAAKQVCAECPVMRECREHALRVREPYGVWGGLSEDDRNHIYGQEGLTERAS